jgi:hypothetical protein
MHDLESRLDPKRWCRRPLFNKSKITLFWCHMKKLWSKHWQRVCWIREWRGTWVRDELQFEKDDGVDVSSVVMSSSSSTPLNLSRPWLHLGDVLIIILGGALSEVSPWAPIMFIGHAWNSMCKVWTEYTAISGLSNQSLASPYVMYKSPFIFFTRCAWLKCS